MSGVPAGRVSGKSIVITGAARGQGAAEARMLAREGAYVLLTDVLDAEGEAVAAELRDMGALADYQHLDVCSEFQWQEVARRLHEAEQPVDGLVNNAGIPQRSRLGHVSVPEWDRTMAVNLTGPMLGIQTLLPLMLSGASVVNVGSVAALTAHHTVAYTASKWGLRGLSRVAAVELGARGIRVNTVHPGHIDTEMVAAASPAFLAAHLSMTPLGRVGVPDDVASTVLFLLSDESSYITGVELAVDGGYTSHGGTKAIIDAIGPA